MMNINNETLKSINVAILNYSSVILKAINMTIRKDSNTFDDHVTLNAVNMDKLLM